MNDFPEGLYLGLTPDETPAIFDAQDVMWIEFTDGGHGDPVRWQSDIIIETCKALGVTEAFGEQGEPMWIDQFINEYHGDLDFVE